MAIIKFLALTAATAVVIRITFLLVDSFIRRFLAKTPQESEVVEGEAEVKDVEEE